LIIFHQQQSFHLVVRARPKLCGLNHGFESNIQAEDREANRLFMQSPGAPQVVAIDKDLRLAISDRFRLKHPVDSLE